MCVRQIDEIWYLQVWLLMIRIELDRGKLQVSFLEIYYTELVKCHKSSVYRSHYVGIGDYLVSQM
jgi:hypothetical protein